MKLNTENKKNREMNSSWTYHHDLHGIHDPGIDEDSRKQTKEKFLQTQVQKPEQTAMPGYFRLWIPAHDTIAGEAG